MRARAALLTVLAVALLLRAIPTLYYGEPFSLDSWPLVRDSEKVLEGVRIWDDGNLDGYNNHWPGVIMTSVQTSIIVGLKTVTVYRFMGPAVCSLAAILVFYALLRRLISSKYAALGMAYFALVPSLLLFTSATIKEVYTYPIVFSVLFLAFTGASRGITDYVTVLLLSFGAVISHHLATTMTAGILASVLLVVAVKKLMNGTIPRAFSTKKIVAGAAFTGLSFIIYYIIYGKSRFLPPITLNDVTALAMYYIFVFVTYAVINSLSISRDKPRVTTYAVILTLIFAIVSIAYVKSVVPSLPPIDASLYLYIIPLLLPLLASLFTDKHVAGTREHVACIYIGMYILIASIAAYTVFYKPEITSILHRFLGYLVIPNTLLLGRKLLNGARVMAVAIVALTAASASVVVFNTCTSPDMATYYWVYRESEVTSFKIIHEVINESERVIGDAKVSYYYTLQRVVLLTEFFKVLKHGEAGKPIILYKDNFSKGYIISINPYRFNPQVLKMLDRVFDSSTVFVLR